MREFVNTTLLEPLTTIGTRILHFLPNLFAAVLILGVGWLLARLLGRGVERLLRMLGVDHLADQLGISAVLTRTGLKPLRSEEHTSELQSPCNLVCRLLLEKKKKKEENMVC